jgi:hypothetical protein
VAAEDDSTLDTSIACDCCDKWYLILSSFMKLPIESLRLGKHILFLILSILNFKPGIMLYAWGSIQK